MIKPIQKIVDIGKSLPSGLTEAGSSSDKLYGLMDTYREFNTSLVEYVVGNTVKIEIQGSDGKCYGYGSGIRTDTGRFLSAWHVYNSALEHGLRPIIKTRQGQALEAKVEWFDSKTDVCVILGKNDKGYEFSPRIEFDMDGVLSRGSHVITFGYQGNTLYKSRGSIISPRSNVIFIGDFEVVDTVGSFTTSAYSYPGFSGGPVIGKEGIVGICIRCHPFDKSRTGNALTAPYYDRLINFSNPVEERVS